MFILAQLPCDFGKTAMAALLVKYLLAQDSTRKIIVVNPNSWLDRAFDSEYFGIYDDTTRLKDELYDP